MTKTVTYAHTNSYEVLYPIISTTRNIWICFHGLGYLSRFFKKYFKEFDASINAVIIPQASAKFYLDKNFKNVGASWLTKVDTQQEMGNNLNYIDQILKQEHINGDTRIVLMGYSQGVSIATRYMVHYNQPVKALILHSGSIPKELDEADGQLIRNQADRIIHISGTQDEYLTDEIITTEQDKIDMLFKDRCEIHRPEIKHVVHSILLNKIAETL